LRGFLVAALIIAGVGSASRASADSLPGAPPPARPDTVALRLVDAGLAVPSGTGRGEVVEPAGLAVDQFGRLYVSDASLHRMQRFERDGRPSAEAGVLGSDPEQMRRPSSVAVLGSLGVAVLDVENRRALTFDLFGRLIGTLIDLTAGDLERELGRIDPIALAADRGGAVYIADREQDRILAFDFSGRFLRTIGGFGPKPGSFRGLAGVASARKGELVVVERTNARVQRLEASGRVLAAWSLPSKPGSGVLAVAVDDSNRVAVTDESAGKLWLFAPDGTPLAVRERLARPRAVVFGPDGVLLVAEAAPGSVRRLRIERASPAPPAER
jgi:DNA-binding beta-propeller fold protein YncE